MSITPGPARQLAQEGATMVDPRRLDLSGVTPRPQPVKPGDLGSEEDGRRLQKEIEEERKWLEEAKTGPLEVALQHPALLLGLAVVAAIVSRLVVIVSRLVYRRFQR
jgi:hypothetical protein